MSKTFTISDVARKLDVAPRTISDLFYGRHLDEGHCPRDHRGRRTIPASYVGEIERVLRERGKIK
jgi:hypothetical protein